MEKVPTINELDKIFNIINSYRKKILLFIIIFFLFAIVAFIFSEHILDFICQPLFLQKKNIVLSSSSVSGVKYLIYTTPMEIILVRTKISVVFSFMILLPLIIYFLINPIDLLKKFKHLYAISIIAVILFYCGIALTFNVFIPIILKFLLNYETNYLLAFWTLRNYTDLIINTCILFGCLCELPLILNVLILSNIVNLEKIIFAKKYIIVFIFVLAAAITPGPDAIAQLVVAVPLWIFFELNLMILKIVYKTKKIKIE